MQVTERLIKELTPVFNSAMILGVTKVNITGPSGTIGKIKLLYQETGVNPGKGFYITTNDSNLFQRQGAPPHGGYREKYYWFLGDLVKPYTGKNTGVKGLLEYCESVGIHLSAVDSKPRGKIKIYGINRS